jgi:hypothetical protein
LTSFFRNFWKILNRTNSEYSINSEYAETPVFDPQTPVFASKAGFFDPNLFPNFFCKIFCEFGKTGFYQKNLELQKWNNSETHGNEKLGKFHLSQGLNK